VGILK